MSKPRKTPPIPEPIASDWITIAEATAIMGVNDSCVRQHLRAGKLRGRKVSPRLWLVYRPDALNYAEHPPTVGRPRSGGA